jgi:hypothetical protein
MALISKNGVKMGRPLKFNSVEDLQIKIDEFFEITPVEDRTITGLALHLNTFRDVLMDYEAGNYDDDKDFSSTIKRAKARIANEYEKRLVKRGNAGDIFALKNFGWSDKQEIDMNIKGEVSLSGLAKQAIDTKEPENDL